MSSSIPDSKSPYQGPDAASVDRAFDALKRYAPGSGRAALLPIDQAVAALENDANARKPLELRLVTALNEPLSSIAREYICAKLARLGSEASVPALARLLGDVALGLSARNALESIPGTEATKALRQCLMNATALQQIGIIDSLGARRDPESVRALTRLLRGADPELSRAALAALGRIGTAKSAKVLQAWLARQDKSLGQPTADAVLTCAESLMADGRKLEAQALYRLLAVPAQPDYVQAAARQGLAAAH